MLILLKKWSDKSVAIKVYQMWLPPEKFVAKFSYPKKSWNRKFQTPKRSFDYPRQLKSEEPPLPPPPPPPLGKMRKQEDKEWRLKSVPLSHKKWAQTILRGVFFVTMLPLSILGLVSDHRTAVVFPGLWGISGGGVPLGILKPFP